MPPTPRRPQSHSIGDAGRTAAKLVFEEWGWTADIVQSDYGEDLDCSVFARGQRTALHFRCQIKSTSRLKPSKSGDYSVPIASTTCAAWLQSYFPIFLVLHEARKKELYFVNATQYLRKNVRGLGKRSVVFHVRSSSRLESSRDVVVNEIQEYFAGLLRLSESIRCMAFPVHMPGYRMALPRTLVSIEGWDFEHSHRDYLPAWTTVFETIDSEHLYGLKRDFARASVEEAYQALTDGFTEVRTPQSHSDNEWLALSCRPISFRGSSAEPGILTGELTGWRSFALVNGRVIDDRLYAFEPPPGFQTEVARHTFSWDGHFHVDPSRDLALQLHAKTPLTPAFRQRSQSLRKNAEGQLLQWSCAATSLPQLEEMLRSVGLVFSVIDQFSTDDMTIGVIHDPMFIVNSDFSAMPMARDWDTFDQGAVKKALRKLPADRLPGKEAGTDVLEFALGQVPWLTLNPPETFYSHEHDTPIGLPGQPQGARAARGALSCAHEHS